MNSDGDRKIKARLVRGEVQFQLAGDGTWWSEQAGRDLQVNRHGCGTGGHGCEACVQERAEAIRVARGVNV